MTQEQKPESAEFRTRRDQLASYPETVCVGRYAGGSWQLEISEDDIDPDHLMEGPVMYVRCDIDHKRRKDAEGAEPIVATHDMAWAAAQKHIELSYGPEATVRRDAIPHFIAIVNAALSVAPRSANVAALEARVKELEVASREYLEAQDIMQSKGILGASKYDFLRRNKARDELRAAAIREGGEHE